MAAAHWQVGICLLQFLCYLHNGFSMKGSLCSPGIVSPSTKRGHTVHVSTCIQMYLRHRTLNESKYCTCNGYYCDKYMCSAWRMEPINILMEKFLQLVSSCSFKLLVQTSLALYDNIGLEFFCTKVVWVMAWVFFFPAYITMYFALYSITCIGFLSLMMLNTMEC